MNGCTSYRRNESTIGHHKVLEFKYWNNAKSLTPQNHTYTRISSTHDIWLNAHTQKITVTYTSNLYPWHPTEHTSRCLVVFPFWKYPLLPWVHPFRAPKRPLFRTTKVGLFMSFSAPKLICGGCPPPFSGFSSLFHPVWRRRSPVLSCHISSASSALDSRWRWPPPKSSRAHRGASGLPP